MFLCMVLVLANLVMFQVLYQGKSRYWCHDYYKEFQSIMQDRKIEKDKEQLELFGDGMSDFQHHFAVSQHIFTQDMLEEYHQYIIETYGTKALQEIEKQNQTLTYDQSAAYLYYSDQCIKRLDYVKEYEQFRNGIGKDDFLTIGIFQKNRTFAKNNINKTKEAYQKLGTVEIATDNHYAIKDFLTYSYSAVFLLVIAFLLATMIIRMEEDAGLFMLVKSQRKGKTKLILAKLLALLVVLFVFDLLVEGSIFGITTYFFQDNDWNMSIQSIPEFRNCCMPLKAWQFALLCVSTRFIAVYMAGVFFICLFLLFRKNWIIYLSTGIILGLFFWGYTELLPNGTFALFKYANIFQGLLPANLYGTYQNIPIDSYPISTTVIYWIFFLIFFVCAVLAAERQWNHGTVRFAGIFRKKKRKKTRGKATIIGSILYMYFIQEKKIVLCVLVLALGIYTGCFKSVVTIPITLTQADYQEEIKELQGPLTKETEKAIERKDKFFEKLWERVMELEMMDNQTAEEQAEQTALETQTGNPYAAHLELKEQYDRIKKRQEQGKDAHLLDVYVWNRLFQGNADEVKNFMFAGIFCIIVCGSFFENKKNINKLIVTTQYGRRHLWRKQYILGIGCGILAWCSFLLPEIIRFFRINPDSYWSASVGNLDIMANTGLECSIGKVVFLMYLARLVICITIAVGTMFLVYLTDNMFMSMTVVTACILGAGIVLLKKQWGVLGTIMTKGTHPLQHLAILLGICSIILISCIVFWEIEWKYKVKK